MIDVELILHKMESFGLIRLNKITGDYYSVYCPIHKDGQERRPSCGVLLHDQYKAGKKYPAGFVHCFGCGYAKTLPELITDLLKRRNISQSGIDWLKENIPGFNPELDSESLIPPDLALELGNKYSAIDFFKKMKLNQKTYVSEEELQQYRFTVQYMYDRKMTDEAIAAFDVGFDEHFVPPGWNREIPCITMPVRDINFNTLFLCRRSIEGKYFFYPEGVSKPIYGIELIPKGCKSLIIVESCINAITCFVYGYPAVALLGTGDDYQIKQLRNLGIHEFVLCFDNDTAGDKGVIRMKKNLSDVAILWQIVMPQGRDVNDVTKEEFDNLYNNKI